MKLQNTKISFLGSSDRELNPTEMIWALTNYIHERNETSKFNDLKSLFYESNKITVDHWKNLW